jgi:hypothetical protein
MSEERWISTGAMMGGSWGYYPDTPDGAVYYKSEDGALERDELTFPDGRRQTVYRVSGENTEFYDVEKARRHWYSKANTKEGQRE